MITQEQYTGNSSSVGYYSSDSLSQTINKARGKRDKEQLYVDNGRSEC